MCCWFITCVKTYCDLRQVTRWSDSSYSVKSVKLSHDLIEIVKWLGIYCSTDYLSLYDDDWDCVV